MAMMTCRELTRFLADYLSGELAAETRARFEAHLAVCPPCVSYLESYRETIRLAREAFGEPAAASARDLALPAAPEELVKAILAARRR